MNTRLAQIIAASTGPDGKPDRSKIYEALLVNPDDPVTLLIEAFMAADGSFQGLKLEQAKNVRAIEQALQTELLQLVREFGLHKQALANAKGELGTAFAVRNDQLEAHAKRLAEQAAIGTAAAQLAIKAAESQAAASADAVEKVLEAAERVAEAHRLAAQDGRQTHEKLKNLAQSISDRELLWLYLFLLIFGAALGIVADHWLILPHWNS